MLESNLNLNKSISLPLSLSNVGCLRADHKFCNLGDLELVYLTELRISSFVEFWLDIGQII